MTTFDCTKIKDERYSIVIKSKGNGRPITVLVDMPETMSITASSEWESRLPYQLFTNLVGAIPGIGNAATAGVNMLGLNNISQDLSAQMWTDSSPLELHMSLFLDAETDAYLDVWAPLMLLSGQALPIGGDKDGNYRNGTGLSEFLEEHFLYPPGPLNGDPDSPGAIHLFIGKMLFFKDCIMLTSAPQWDSRLDERGYPISGQLDLTFRTSKIYGRNDWMVASGVQGL